MKTNKLNKKTYKLLNEIKKLSRKYSNLDINDFKKVTENFKANYKESHNLDALLPDAYAAVAQVSKIVLGMYPYDTQLLGAIELHNGNIIDMKTGEGKTLCAIFPLYLNTLTGKTVVLATVNEYLALRDSNLMKKVFEVLGLNVSVNVNEDITQDLTIQEKTNVYHSDVVYVTHSKLVFDYLLDNLRKDRESFFIKDKYFIILDEADTVLLDAAQNPLVISGAEEVESNLYKLADTFMSVLSENEDYELDKENEQVWFTEKGLNKIKKYFCLKDIFAKENTELFRHLIFALKSYALFKKDMQYVVYHDTVMLLEKGLGRMMANTKLNSGQHQALETKEGLSITKPTKAMASITYYGFLSLFDKVAGMSGSAFVAKKEIYDLYKLRVIDIPTNKKTIRIDKKEIASFERRAEINLAVNQIAKANYKQQPVLVVGESIKVCYEISRQLKDLKITHNVLDAYSSSKEADIISRAGIHGCVTIATPMVGRGTDIMLDETAKKRGGLIVVIVGKPLNARTEVQIRGRSGRQGDPGTTYMFTSLDDQIVINNGSFHTYDIKAKHNINEEIILSEIKLSQQLYEEKIRQSRKTSIELDEAMQIQRTIIYDIRNKVLKNCIFEKQILIKWCRDFIWQQLKNFSEVNQVKKLITDYFIFDWSKIIEHNSNVDDSLKKQIFSYIEQLIEQKENFIKQENLIKRYYMLAVLNAIDSTWIDEVDYLEQLRISINARSTNQKDSKFDFGNAAYNAFGKMFDVIKKKTIKNFFLGEILIVDNNIEILLP